MRTIFLPQSIEDMAAEQRDIRAAVLDRKARRRMFSPLSGQVVRGGNEAMLSVNFGAPIRVQSLGGVLREGAIAPVSLGKGNGTTRGYQGL